MASQDHVFNQYYFDLLNKLKKISRGLKYESHDARVVLRGIKKSYLSWDKLSPSYRKYVNEFADAWDAYPVTTNMDELAKWVGENGDTILYKDIAVGSVSKIMKDTHMFHHYLTILNLFRKDMPETTLSQCIDVLRNLNKDEVKDKLSVVKDENIKAQLQKIVDMAQSRPSASSKPSIDNITADIENTSLGKLAKEILQEVNVDELQSSLGDGDIMKALANPDGGLVKLLGTVSQKMISKMSTGELKQENLLQDAMKLAGQLGGKELGALGNIAKMFGGGGDDGFDISQLASMMGGGAGNMGRHRVVKSRDIRRRFNKAKENVKVTVEDSNE
jgi:hypothetical protein